MNGWAGTSAVVWRGAELGCGRGKPQAQAPEPPTKWPMRFPPLFLRLRRPSATPGNVFSARASIGNLRRAHKPSASLRDDYHPPSRPPQAPLFPLLSFFFLPWPSFSALLHLQSHPVHWYWFRHCASWRETLCRSASGHFYYRPPWQPGFR